MELDIMEELEFIIVPSLIADIAELSFIIMAELSSIIAGTLLADVSVSTVEAVLLEQAAKASMETDTAAKIIFFIHKKGEEKKEWPL
jgi:hypothetical protein